MKFTLALLSNVLIATTLAAPGGLEGRVARRAAGLQRRATRSSGPLKKVDSFNTPIGNTTQVEYSSNWAGAVIESPPSGQTFNSVVGTFTVPTPKVPSGVSGSTYAASAWVGIDGDTYSTAILQTGIDFTITKAGAVSFDAWYEWYPDYAYDFSLAVKAGDVITLSVTSSTTKKGVAKISNVTTGKSVSITLTSTSPLGGKNAEWIVEDFEENGTLVPFANFGTVTFSNAVASTASSSEGPGSATILDIESSAGKVLTDVTVGSSTVTVTYV
ncbi:peptidase A4 family protein [Phlyctema vagabunda]|uniref:Peptidase A4 family protein n=1 Tax=Phlyctema vagabunda TaxID=108571 RepID=A0ABR4PP02_9HELO